MINLFVNGLRLVYIINTRTPCVCVSVISNYSGTEGCSAMPFSPTWRASPGELEQLLLEFTWCLVWEEKPLELFHRYRMKPRSSCYNGAILKKLVLFLATVQLLCLQLGCRKIEECHWCVGSFAKAGWKLWHSGNCLRVSRNGLTLAS